MARIATIVDQWLDGKLHALREDALFRERSVVSSSQGPVVQSEMGSLLCFCSNNYLGLANDPALIEAVAAGARDFGCSASASPLISGHMSPHARAEEALADWLEVEATLLFSSGYATNLSVLTALFEDGGLIVSDELNHASIIDGCRQSRAEVVVFPNNDLERVRQLLTERRGHHAHCLVVTDAIFSMDGHGANVAGLRALCDEFDAWLMVDEAHGVGVVGPEGRGWSAGKEVKPDILVGTLGKALGLGGAFAAGSRSLIDWLRHRARGHVFSTALPPPIAAAVPTSVKLVREANGARANLARNVGLLAREDTPSDAGIVSHIIGDPAKTMLLSAQLKQSGFWVGAVRPPTVAVGTSRLRIVPMATHSEADVRRLASAMREMA